MKILPSAIDGIWVVKLDVHYDERGFFARSFCEAEFAAAGLTARFEQSSISHNRLAGTLRGMHFQDAPNAETKFVRCVRGSVYDVAVDIRSGSATRGQWLGETLTAENGLGLLIGPGFAHGFQTLEDDSDVLYQITPAFRSGFGRGIRWNDPNISISWPIASPLLSERDATYPDWAA